ncbi:MAG TPA: hypothetical protein VK497_01410 [Candidatus Saccharimonadales bacterium]|nr:hypothetical protein [Candidatus Saccharimonadales bacterium]
MFGRLYCGPGFNNLSEVLVAAKRLGNNGHFPLVQDLRAIRQRPSTIEVRDRKQDLLLQLRLRGLQ